MDINEACRGVVYRSEEAKKENLTGQIKVTLTYQNGGLTKASYEKSGSLLPGSAPPPPFDVPGKNLG